MRKLMLTIAMALFFFELFSQQTSPAPALTRQDYLKKSKNQKKAAWILLGGGTVMMITGSVIWSNAVEDNVDPDNPLSPLLAPATTTKGTGLVLAGLLVSAGSIPLFIASGKNRRKAAALSFDFQKVHQVQNSAFVNKSLPSLTLKFNL